MFETKQNKIIQRLFLFKFNLVFIHLFTAFHCMTLNENFVQKPPSAQTLAVVANSNFLNWSNIIEVELNTKKLYLDLISAAAAAVNKIAKLKNLEFVHHISLKIVRFVSQFRRFCFSTFTAVYL